MKTIYLISVAVHILSAAIWVGGMAFLVFALMPVLRRPEHQSGPPALPAVARRFRNIGWLCLGLLILSGVANLALTGVTWQALIEGTIWEGSHGRILAWKLSLVGALIAISALHDFWVGPKAVRLAAQRLPPARAWRRAASWMGRLTLALALVVLYLAVRLVRG
jgi:putative copper export protein